MSVNMFIVLENIVNFNPINLFAIFYLLVVSLVLFYRKKPSKFDTIYFYFNSLIVYPLLINKFVVSFSLSFLIVWVVIVILYLSPRFLVFNREILIFLLTIPTLKCSLLDLYINVDKFRTEIFLLVGVLNYLWFTTGNTSKIVKKATKKVSKSKED